MYECFDYMCICAQDAYSAPEGQESALESLA